MFWTLIVCPMKFPMSIFEYQTNSHIDGSLQKTFPPFPQLPDIRSLTRAIANSDSITSLFLSSNQIDDEKV